MSETWRQLIVNPIGGTTGANVTQLINMVSEPISADFIFAEGIDGAGISDLPVNTPTLVKTFLNACASVKQFDWADLYLLEKLASEEFRSFEQCGNYPDVIQQSRATIRVLDGEYIYIYNRSGELMNLQQRLPKVTEPAQRKLTDFVYPI